MKHPHATHLFSLATAALTTLVSPMFAQDDPDKPPAGHSDHGEVFNQGPRQSAYLMHGCGKVHLPVRVASDLGQQFFDQGLGQLHGFWHFESERSFRQVAKIDPSCAMAYWGMAMANVDNPDRAAGFIEEAVVRREHASARNRLWIDALAGYYEVTRDSAKAAMAGKNRAKDPDAKPTKRTFKASKKDRSKRLAEAYEQMVEAYPQDIEAKAFLVNRVWLNRRARLPTKNYERMESLLKDVFAVNPDHPAHHYRIHLWDRKDARRALVSAAVSGQVAPAVAHQWHMSGHIFAKLNRHEDAVWQQSASARVDHARMMRDRVMPHRIHNFGHNNEWLCRSLAHCGRVKEALSLAKNMVELPRHPERNQLSKRSSIAGYGRTKLLETCRKFELLDELRALHDGGYFAGDESVVAAELAQAYLILGDLERGKAQMAIAKKRAKAAARTAARPVAKAEAAGSKKAAVQGASTKGGTAKQLDPQSRTRRGRSSRRSRGSNRAVRDLDGLLLLAEGKIAAARKKLTRLTLAKIYQADVRLRLGEVKAARKLIDAENKRNPHRAEIVARRIRILMADGDDKAARAAFDDLRRFSGHGDLDSPLLQSLAKVAKQFGYPEDWRLPQAQRKDVGVRPPLDELGPFRWQPSPARDWSLPSTDGRRITLSKDYKGKPVLVIFYLGFGCLHCVEQLQAFHPMADAYRKAGIEIVAIGTDTVAGMSKSLADMSAADRFAFPLVADPKLEVFKQWRCFDDFEQMELHGTFLVDADGKVRWQDISYEPFDQPKWLLTECQRILKLVGHDGEK